MTDLVVSKLERVTALSSVANFEAFCADIAVLNSIVMSIEKLGQLTRAVEAARRPATREEIAIHLAMLMANFPNGKANEDSTSIMLEYIHAQQPSIFAVKRAVRHLISTAKYQPVTADVLEAIESGTKEINNAKWHLELRLKEIARREEEERQRKVEQETTRERDIEECCRRLEDAKDVGWYKPDIIEEARRRIGAEDLGGY